MSLEQEVFELRVAGREVPVVSFRGREALSRLYRFDIDVDAPRELSAATLLREPAAFTIHVHGMVREVVGIVDRVRWLGAPRADARRLRVRLVPRMALLERRCQSRIFQGKSVPQVVTTVLAHKQVENRWELTKSYVERSYCVQYEEHDYAFVRRLLSEAGIWFYFDRGTVVFCDSVDGYAPLGDAVLFRERMGEMIAGEHVSVFDPCADVRPEATFLRDYDFERPLLDLSAGVSTSGIVPAMMPAPTGETSADGSRDIDIDASHGQLEIYDHHGDFKETDVSHDHAVLRLEQHRRSAATASGASTSCRLQPGRSFELSEHPSEAGDYAVIAVNHRGVVSERSASAVDRPAPTYENDFRVVPAHVPFRPKRRRRIVHQALESAVVVGPRDEEIFVDRHGRVKVQFHWDREGRRDEHSSCWLRVMLPWAGRNFGSHFLPRIGMEVLVSFIGGDPDRPVVIGCVHNVVQPTPWQLPEGRTRSGLRTRSSPGGGGFNELSFEDKAGEEQVLLHAQRDLEEQVLRDHRTVVGGERHDSVALGSVSEVGGDRRELTRGSREERVLGSRATLVELSERLEVRGDRRVVVDHGFELAVGGARRVRVGGQHQATYGDHYREHVHGDRTTVVLGEAVLTAAQGANATVQDSCSLNVDGETALVSGSMTTRIHRSMRTSVGGAVSWTAHDGFQIAVGNSKLSIAPDSIVVKSPAITLKADTITLSTAGAAVAMNHALVAKSASITLRSDGDAIIGLDSEARVDASKVKLNCGAKPPSEAQDEEQEEDAEQPDTHVIRLFDRAGNELSNAPYEISAQGLLERGTASGGRVRVPRREGMDRVHLRWGRPPGAPGRPADAPTYEYEMDVFVRIDTDDEAENARRRMHNLGYQGDSAARRLQIALGEEDPSGELEEGRLDAVYRQGGPSREPTSE